MPDMSAVAYAVAADGSGDERELSLGADLDFSRNGRYVVFHSHDAASAEDLWIAEIPEGGRIDDAQPRKLLGGRERHRCGRISPTGNVVAFELRVGDESDVYLSEFPGGEGLWQVSTGGGRDPRWSSDGSRLYFLDDDGALHAVSVRTTPSIRLGRPELLFASGTNGIELSRGYDVAEDAACWSCASSPTTAGATSCSCRTGSASSRTAEPGGQAARLETAAIIRPRAQGGCHE